MSNDNNNVVSLDKFRNKKRNKKTADFVDEITRNQNNNSKLDKERQQYNKDLVKRLKLSKK